jgi:deoxycytidylate deaminase
VSAGENPGHEKRCHAVHAEVNAILQLGGNGGPQTIYVSKVPCFYCALIIVSTQIKAVVCFEHEGMAKDGAKVLAKADILYLWDKEKQHAQKIAF